MARTPVGPEAIPARPGQGAGLSAGGDRPGGDAGRPAAGLRSAWRSSWSTSPWQEARKGVHLCCLLGVLHSLGRMIGWSSTRQHSRSPCS